MQPRPLFGAADVRDKACPAWRIYVSVLILFALQTQSIRDWVQFASLCLPMFNSVKMKSALEFVVSQATALRAVLDIIDDIQLGDRYEIDIDLYRSIMTNRARWGPLVWWVIHDYCLRHSGDASELPEFMRCVGLHLPCESCTHHFGELLKRHPLPDNTHPFAWSVQLHNAVSLRIGKLAHSIAAEHANRS